MASERLTVTEVETVIRQLRDVIGARVVSDSAGVIQEIHVLTHSDRTPKQVVRDVESALQARLGISFDHKKVSVAQVQGPRPEIVSRPEFYDLSLSLTGQTARTTVQIRKDDNVFSGTASGSSSVSGQIKAVATATINAVEACAPATSSMLVEDALLFTLGGQQVVAVLVTLAGDRQDEVLCGSCVVRQDVVKAAVFATLDAVNRRLTRTH